MHDIKLIRSDPESFDRDIVSRGETAMAMTLIELDKSRRKAIQELEEKRAAHKRKMLDKIHLSINKEKDNPDFIVWADEMAAGRERIRELEKVADETATALRESLEIIPNRPLPEVPIGVDEADNVEIRKWGVPRTFGFEPLEHHEISGTTSGMDFKTAARLSGSRFCILSGSIARLHRALGQYMIDVQVQENGLSEVWTPVLVNPEVMYGTSQLPKFADDSYRTDNDKWLIPTAEVALTNIVRDSVVAEDYLPRRYCALTQCFRQEAGAAGKDTTGMLRQHQFEKVEMVSITRPEDSENEQERMLRCAETILERLNIPYRTVLLCTGDMGFGASKTYDVEAWLPGQGKYREISSVSNCQDFQARRMNARYSSAKGGAPRFVHTLNGSGLAVGRTLIAVLENGQNRDGSITLPDVLAPYIGGMTRIDSEGRFETGTG